MIYHRDGKNRRSNVRNTRGVVYTIDRAPLSQIEVDSLGKDRAKKKDGIKNIAELSREVKRKIEEDRKKPKSRRSVQSQRRQISHVSEGAASQVSVRRESFQEKQSLGGRKRALFYLCLGASVAAVTVFIILAALGMFSPNLSTVKINDAGRVVFASTTEKTVGELLEKNGIKLGDSDVLEVSLAASVEDDMEIVIRRAATLSIQDSDKSIQVKMLAGTVGEALERAGVALGSMDEVYPSKDAYIYAGMSITIIRVEVKYETETEVLAFKEVTKETTKYAKGKTVLVQEGKEGSQENTIEIVLKNGEEYSRTIIEKKVINEPVDEIVYVGTYVAPKVNTGADNAKDASGKLKKVPSITQIHTGTWAQHKAVASPSESIIAKTIIADTVTAYAPTGNKTATGTWPRIGTIAANPKQVPYGTKIYVPGYGYGRVEDTGANRHDLSKYFFDVFFESKGECRQWGRKRNVKVYILK